jgi:polysaccharide biosynthesis protein PelC
MCHRASVALLLLPALAWLGACGGTMKATQFTNPKFNFAFVQRVAVLPFDNESTDRQAGSRATRLAITELLATGAVDVVEPGEVQAALVKIAGAVPGRPTAPSTEQVLALGKALNVQALLLGSVTQSENLRSGAVPIPVVTIDLHLVETETGAAVWATTQSEKGGSVEARVLGTGGEPIAETTRRCVREAIKTLVK